MVNCLSRKIQLINLIYLYSETQQAELQMNGKHQIWDSHSDDAEYSMPCCLVNGNSHLQETQCLHQLFLQSFILKDEGTMILWNISNYLPINKASHSRELVFSSGRLHQWFYIYIYKTTDDNLMSLNENTTMNNEECIQQAIKDIGLEVNS